MFTTRFTKEQIKHLGIQLRAWLLAQERNRIGETRAVQEIIEFVAKLSGGKFNPNARVITDYPNDTKNKGKFDHKDYYIHRFLDHKNYLNLPIFMSFDKDYIEHTAINVAMITDASLSNKKAGGIKVRRGEVKLAWGKRPVRIEIDVKKQTSGNWWADVDYKQSILLFDPKHVVGTELRGQTLSPASIGIVTNCNNGFRGVIAIAGSTKDLTKLFAPVSLTLADGKLNARSLSEGVERMQAEHDLESKPRKFDKNNNDLYSDLMLKFANANEAVYKEKIDSNTSKEELLYWAILAGDMRQVYTLIPQVKDINFQLKDQRNETALHAAATSQNFEALDLLLKRKDIDVDVMDDDSLSAWDHAAIKGWRLEFTNKYGYNFAKKTKPFWKRTFG